MNGITVIAVENDQVEMLFALLKEARVPYYELDKFFELEGFSTLEEVETWWTGK